MGRPAVSKLTGWTDFFETVLKKDYLLDFNKFRVYIFVLEILYRDFDDCKKEYSDSKKLQKRAHGFEVVIKCAQY